MIVRLRAKLLQIGLVLVLAWPASSASSGEDVSVEEVVERFISILPSDESPSVEVGLDQNSIWAPEKRVLFLGNPSGDVEKGLRLIFDDLVRISENRIQYELVNRNNATIFAVDINNVASEDIPIDNLFFFLGSKDRDFLFAKIDRMRERNKSFSCSYSASINFSAKNFKVSRVIILIDEPELSSRKIANKYFSPIVTCIVPSDLIIGNKDSVFARDHLICTGLHQNPLDTENDADRGAKLVRPLQFRWFYV